MFLRSESGGTDFVIRNVVWTFYEFRTEFLSVGYVVYLIDWELSSIVVLLSLFM